MSAANPKDEGDGSIGCIFFIGVAIVAICVGKIYEPVYGWLFLGASLIAGSSFVVFLMMLAAISAARSKAKGDS